MKELPDEKTLLELRELAKDASRKAREMNDLAIAISQKWQGRLAAKQAAKQQAGKTE